jgi:hypothetical protein
MTTNTTEAQLKAAAAKLQSEDSTLQPERAEQLARLVMEAANEKIPAPTGEPTPKPATRPVAPRLPDMTGMSPAEKSAAWRKQEQDLAAWDQIAKSYIEPISDAAMAAKARLLELRAASEASTDAERVRRAMEREKLMETIIAGGMARL